jgi:hypothetical protein
MICSPRPAASRSPATPPAASSPRRALASSPRPGAYSDYGEVETYTATVGGVVQIAWSYVRDDLGRIVEKTETTPAGTRVLVYEYDLAGSPDPRSTRTASSPRATATTTTATACRALNADGVFDAGLRRTGPAARVRRRSVHVDRQRRVAGEDGCGDGGDDNLRI